MDYFEGIFKLCSKHSVFINIYMHTFIYSSIKKKLPSTYNMPDTKQSFCSGKIKYLETNRT